MADQFIETFLTIPDAEFRLWLEAQQTRLDIPFMETIRQYAERVSIEGDLRGALHILERAEIIADFVGQPLATAVTWRGRANIYQRHDRFEESLAASQQAAAIYKIHGTPFDVAKAQAIEVFVLGALERFEEAIELAEWIRPLFQARQFLLGEAVVTVNLARVYVKQWQYEKALTEFRRAYDLYVELEGYEDRVGVILHDMGIACEQLDRLDLAADHYQQAYPLLVAAKDVRTIVKNQFNQAQLSIRQANFAQALAYITQARADTATLVMSEDHAFINLYEAQIRRQLGEQTQAVALLQTALSQFQAMGNQINQIEVLVELAQTVATNAQGDSLSEAVTYLEQAEGLLVSLEMPLFLGFVMLQKGEFLLHLNRLSAAMQAAASARDIFSENALPLRLAQANTLLADCSWQRQSAQARALYHTTLEIIGTDIPSLAARCWVGLGRIAQNTGDADTAVRAYEKAITLFDQMRHGLHTHPHRAGFLENKQALFADLLTALHAHNDTSIYRVFYWIERFKAQSLAELLSAQPVDTQLDDTLKTLLTRREQLRATLDRLQSDLNLAETSTRTLSRRQRSAVQQYDQAHLEQLTEKRRQLHRLEEKIAQRQNVAFQWRDSGDIAPPNVHQLLDEETLLISYYTTDAQLFALTVTQKTGDIQTHALHTSLREVQRLWQQASRWVIRPAQNAQQTNSRLAQLWQKLIAPLNQQLIRKKRLLILPHRDLYQIPFAALYDKSNRRYLIERWQLQLAPSATILNWCRQPDAGTGNPLLVGYPGQQGQREYLSGVPEEIRQIKHVFPKAAVVQDEQATANRILEKMANRPLIHLAGHIYYDAQKPLDSGMPLADGRWLRASDLYLRYGRLHGSLVVLSGCSSGRGRAVGGDVLGLTSAFLYAGATAVVAGLWQVSDEATTTLMSTFYRSLAKGASVATALRTAQLSLLQAPAFRHPFYWSPFQLNGDNHSNILTA